MAQLEPFLAGMVTAGFLLAGLFFCRYWVRSRDPLFAAFSAAFWLLAFDQGLLTLADIPREEQSWTFLLRLLAFGLIAGAVLNKNARPRSDNG